jgi:hypothetical protein
MAQRKSSGGWLVGHQTVNLQPWVQIRQSPQQIVYCQPLHGLPSGMVLHCRLSFEGQQRRINTKRASGPPQKIMKKNFIYKCRLRIYERN